MQFTSAPVSTLTTMWCLWGPLGCVAIGNLRCFPSGPLVASIWLIVLSIFTLGGFGHLTPNFIDVGVNIILGWCLDKIGSLGPFPGLAYLVEVSYFVTVLALGILSWTFLSWLVLWFSTTRALSFHPWGFSRLMTDLKIYALQNYSVPGSFH